MKRPTPSAPSNNGHGVATHLAPRLDTGISGLNDILLGGLPPGQMYLIEGEPGTGKTTVAMQFIRAGMARGEKSLFITLSEPRSELLGTILSHGWDPAEVPIAEFTPAEASLSPEEQYTVFHPSEIELATTVRKLTQFIDQEQPLRLVIDSLSELRLLASDVMRYRRQLLALKQFFSGRETTVMMLDDRTTDGNDFQLRSIAHGVIHLSKVARSFGITRRQVEIVKLRGSAYREGFHDYTIEHGGVCIFPRLIASEHDATFGDERIVSGIPALDKMFGGGIARGSSTLLTGPTGVGKSTIAMQYAYTSARRGERAIIYSFDEVLNIAKRRCQALGMELQPELERGTLAMSQIDPAELSPGEFIWQIRRDVEEKDTRVVVIDSLNGFLNSMPGERDMILHLHELLAFLNQKGVITFLILTMQGLVGTMHAEVDASYVADTVVLLRYYENEGEIKQVVSVLKQRVGPHERTLREFSMGINGIYVGEALSSFRGVLTGVPDQLETASKKGKEGITDLL
jgi:circadian clock protein KaiC